LSRVSTTVPVLPQSEWMVRSVKWIDAGRRTATLLRFEEPSDADPHVRWYGEGGQR
jgi:hypothetical protein